MIVVGCAYGRSIPKKPNSKRNNKGHIYSHSDYYFFNLLLTLQVNLGGN